MKLSILICTLPKRLEQYERLCKVIYCQIYSLKALDSVNFISDEGSKEISVGAKRNSLLQKSTGDYIVFIDDDDTITDNYIERLLEGISTGADVICFHVAYHHNGAPAKSVYYDKDFLKDSNLPDKYLRIPNHLMCVKRELALQAGFPDKSFGEDAAYAKRLLPLLKTQHIIPEILYHYHFNSQTTETQGR